MAGIPHLGEGVKDPQTGCIIAPGFKDKDGYAQRWFRNATRRAHRVTWIKNFGEIPEGMKVLHKCDNPPCINPEHLFLGTPADNARDRDAKGRWDFRGSKCNFSKLTEQAVKVIRLAALAGCKQKFLSEHYGITRPRLSNIINWRLWKHVS